MNADKRRWEMGSLSALIRAANLENLCDLCVSLRLCVKVSAVAQVNGPLSRGFRRAGSNENAETQRTAELAENIEQSTWFGCGLWPRQVYPRPTFRA
jgi:hypothetical protein